MHSNRKDVYLIQLLMRSGQTSTIEHNSALAKHHVSCQIR